MKRVYCLYRVSTKGQVDKDDIPMQKTSCREFVERNGWTILKEFQEKGVSGFKVSASNRDAIQDLKAAAEKKEFDVLLVFMFDRIGRIDDETPFVVEWFIKQGIEVWSVNEGEQRMDNHVDKLMNYIRFWQANGESQKTSARVKTRLNQMTLDGKFTGGVESPYIERLHIIDENIFDQAQFILKQRSSKNEEKQQIARTTKGSTLLSGNIYCAHCGQKMVSTSYIDRYDRADGSQYRVRRQRYICTNKAMKRGACDGQSAYVAHGIDGAVLATLRNYLAKIKSTPKDIALEKRYKSEISEYKRKQTKIEKEIDKLKRQVIELSAEIGRSLLGESRFTPDILSTSIDNTNDLLHKKEIELSDIKYKLANQQNAMGRLDFYYSQFRTWADEFDNSTMEQKKMIACQLIREVKVLRGYELEIIFDLNYEQFLSL